MGPVEKLPEQTYFKASRYTAWDVLKLYWRSDERWVAYGSVALVLFLTVGLVSIDLIFNYWNNYFYDALQAYDKRGVLHLLFIFFAIAAVYMTMAVYRYYVSQFFGLRWRKWLTNQFVGRWLERKSYYLLETFDEKTDNPDQRIQEDVGAIISITVDLVIGVVASVTTFFTFIYVLWSLSGPLVIPMGSYGTLKIPAYLVWVSILYAGIGTWLTFKIGRPLVALNFEQQKREATFRYAAVEVRNHAEHIALYEGEHHQETILSGLFDAVFNNYYAIILRQKLLLWFTAGYNQVSVVLPLMAALPNYFNKVFKLGGLMQSLHAFGRVQDSLSFIVNGYTQIAQWQAVAKRLTTFVNHMGDVEKQAAEENGLVIREEAGSSIIAKDVTVMTPRRALLLEHVNLTFEQGHHYLIRGMSGLGKSTFVRAMSGIWPFATGEFIFPAGKKVMYIPQTPYMPIGTLEEAVLFPDHYQPALRARVEEVMRICNLSHLLNRLNEVSAWAEQLSPGEQQRVGFARILLHKPDWIILDESTSMLDLKNETEMYATLVQHLPQCSMISVGHRSSLEAFHDKLVDLTAFGAKQPV